MYPANTIKLLLSLTSTAGRTCHVLLADVIPWINKASLAHAVRHAATNLIFRIKLYGAIEFVIMSATGHMVKFFIIIITIMVKCL